jgi:hypothetical protein
MCVSQSVVNSRRKLLAELLDRGRYLPLEQICRRLSISAATARPLFITTSSAFIYE